MTDDIKTLLADIQARFNSANPIPFEISELEVRLIKACEVMAKALDNIIFCPLSLSDYPLSDMTSTAKHALTQATAALKGEGQ